MKGVAIWAERDQILRRVRALMPDRNQVVNVERKDGPADRVSAFVSGFVQNPVPDVDGEGLSRHLRGLTFELSGRRRQDARARIGKMYRVPQAGPWWPAVGAPLERGVRRHCHRSTAAP